MTGALNTARSTSWGRSPGSVSETTPPSLVSQKPTAAPNGSSAPSKSNASGPNCTTPSTTSARLSRPGPRPTTTNGSSNATATRPHEKHSPQPKARWQHETDTNAVQRTGCCSDEGWPPSIPTKAELRIAAAVRCSVESDPCRQYSTGERYGAPLTSGTRGRWRTPKNPGGGPLTRPGPTGSGG